MQRKILIKAYTNLNLGDDLFIDILCARYPKHQFYLVCPKAKEKPFKKIKNLTVYNPVRYIDSALDKVNLDFSINKLLELYYAEKFDLTIHIGGSLFIESNNSWDKAILHYDSLVKKSKKFAAIGCNFGPYESEWFPIKFQDIFKKMDDICFRDEYSFNKFSNLSNTRLAPDIILSLESSSIKEIKQSNYVVISVIDLSWRGNLKEYTELYEKNIIDISKLLITQGKKVILASFCESEGDEDAINRIINKYSHKNLRSYFYKGNLSESLSLLKSSEGIIATRFHSLVLGWVFGKPVFPFVYSNKTLNLLNDTNYNRYYLSLDKISDINIDQVISQLTQQGPQDVTQERKKAEEHFVKIDEFLSFGNFL